MPKQNLIKVAATKVGVGGVGENTHGARLKGDHGGLSVAMANIEDDDVRGAGRKIRLVDTIAKSRRRRIVHQSEGFQPGNARRVEIRATREVGSVGGNRDDAIGNRTVQGSFSDELEVGEEHGEEVNRGDAEVPIQKGKPGTVLRLGEQEMLDLGEGGAGMEERRRGGSDEALLVGEGNGGRGLTLGLIIEDDIDAALAHGGDDAAVVTDVEADDAHRGTAVAVDDRRRRRRRRR